MTKPGTFQKGDPRINREGQPRNRLSTLAREKMEALGFEPIAEMIKIVLSTRSDKVKQEGTAWLGDKAYPNLKAIEHSGDKEAPVIMRFNLAQVLQSGEE